MKKALVILLTLAIALSLCACGGKTPITGVEFSSRMAELGLEVCPNPALVDREKVLKAFDGGGDTLYVVFYELADEQTAKTGFQNGQLQAPTDAGPSAQVTEAHAAFYSKETASESFMLAYVGSTMMIGWSTPEQSETLKTVFETMGYK